MVFGGGDGHGEDWGGVRWGLWGEQARKKRVGDLEVRLTWLSVSVC